MRASSVVGNIRMCDDEHVTGNTYLPHEIAALDGGLLQELEEAVCLRNKQTNKVPSCFQQAHHIAGEGGAVGVNPDHQTLWIVGQTLVSGNLGLGSGCLAAADLFGDLTDGEYSCHNRSATPNTHMLIKAADKQVRQARSQNALEQAMCCQATQVAGGRKRHGAL